MVKKAIIFVTDGNEETETILPADILRRAGIDVNLVSITGRAEVKSSRDIKLIADELINNIICGDGSIDADMLILPGGQGSASYINCKPLVNALLHHNEKGGYIAAICAAPITLGTLGLLGDKAATCFPARKGELVSKEYRDDHVVVDGNIITARAAGASAQFGFTLAGILAGEDVAQKVKDEMYY